MVMGHVLGTEVAAFASSQAASSTDEINPHLDWNP